jgi:hypothetical protein
MTWRILNAQATGVPGDLVLTIHAVWREDDGMASGRLPEPIPRGRTTTDRTADLEAACLRYGFPEPLDVPGGAR